MSLNNSPHPSTHASSLSPPPYLTDRHSPESQSPSSYDAGYYTNSAPSIHHSSGRQEQQRRSTVGGYPVSAAGAGYGYDSFQQYHASGMVGYESADSSVEYPSNGVLSYSQANGAIPFPTSTTQPSGSNDMYMNGTPEFAPAQLQPDFAQLGVAPRDYLDAGAFASQPPSNAATAERNLIQK